MTFNKNQKILTLVYFISLIGILFFLTPYINYNRYGYGAHIRFGNFFSMTDLDYITYTKFFIEIGIVTVIYYLSLIILKNK